MNRIAYEVVQARLSEGLLKLGFSEARADLCSQLFAETTCDGVYSHGVNRFPRFVAMVRNGNVDVAAEPRVAASFGAMEQWDGQRGPGILLDQQDGNSFAAHLRDDPKHFSHDQRR